MTLARSDIVQNNGARELCVCVPLFARCVGKIYVMT